MPQRAFGVGQLSAPFVQYTERFYPDSAQYTEQTAEQCETFTDSEVLRISGTHATAATLLAMAA